MFNTKQKRQLSGLERAIVLSVAKGYTDTDIAHQLLLSEEGVKSQLVNVFRKLNVSNRLELVIHALGHGLLQQHGEAGESSVPALPNA